MAVLHIANMIQQYPLFQLVTKITGKVNIWRRKWQSAPELLPGKSHGPRSLVGYSPWGREESDTTERLHVHVQG